MKVSGRKKVYILSMILGYSRYRVNVASEDVRQLSLFQSIEIEFKYFGGVPEEILINNPRQFIDNAKLGLLLVENCITQESKDLYPALLPA